MKATKNNKAKFIKQIRNILLIFLTACSSQTVEKISIKPTNSLNSRGAELVKGLAACGSCHGQDTKPGSILSGGHNNYDLYGKVTATNITQGEKTAIGSWSIEDIITFFRSAITKEGRAFSPEVHKGYEWLSDEDLFSMAVYLKSLPAVEHKVSKRDISFITRNTTGFLEGDNIVTGSVPGLDKTQNVAYGLYLTNTVARCNTCHNSPSGIIQNEKYLKGGKKIKNDKGEKWSPDITQSQKFGIGSWSENDLMKFFLEGVTPEGKKVDSDFCPVTFYKLASEEDLQSIVSYLKTVNG